MSSEYICDVTFADKVNLKFSTFERVDEWARKELEAWNIFFQISPHIFSEVAKYFNGSALESDLKAIVNSGSPNKISLLQAMSSNYITSKSALGKEILALATKDPSSAVRLYTVSCPKFSELSRSIHIAGSSGGRNENSEKRSLDTLRAFLDVYVLEKKIKGLTASDRKAYEQLQTDCQGLHSECIAFLDYFKQQQGRNQNDFNAFKEGTAAEAKTLFGDLKKEIDGIKEFYKAELGLQMPVSYWREKASEHRKLLRAWSIFFTFIIILLCIFTPTIFKESLEVVSHTLASFSEQGKSDISHLAPWLFFVAVSFPLFLSIWFLRLIAKTLISHQNHMNDASLRVVMTTTFLALMNEKKADEKDRILILNALFHVPANVNEDGSPPHWFEILQSRLRGGGGV